MKIPAEMCSLPHWVIWRREARDGKATKVPYQAKSPRLHAKPNDASTWSDFETALQSAAQGDGIGFMVGVEPSGIILVDLDHCMEDGELADWAREIAAACNSYTEVSPSGTGLHCFFKGKLPASSGKFGDAEIYDKLRYFTVTGKADPDFNSSFRTLTDEETAQIYGLCRARKPERALQAQRTTPAAEDTPQKPALSDDALLRKMFRSKSGAKIQALWNGDTSAYGGDDSCADMALCSYLAFWTGRDAQKMDAIFRQSGLMRVKWDQNSGEGKTYGQRTIEKAIAGCTEVYSPAAHKKSKKMAVAVPEKSGKAETDAIRARLYEIMMDRSRLASERNRLIGAEIVVWLHQRGKFYKTERHKFNEVLFFDTSRKILLPVQGDYFTGWLSDILALNRAETVFKFVQAAVETEGLSDRSELIEPEKFWASRPGAFYLSCGPGRMARISAEKVEFVDNGTGNVLFAEDTLPEWKLIEPRNPFEACSLFKNIQTTALHGRMLFMLWVISLPSNQRTKAPLCLTGTVGSGKTRLIKGVFELYGIDPRIDSIPIRDGEKDFWAAIDSGGLTCFDNCDTRTYWLSDALAAAATGGTQGKKKLYTDAARITLKARSWIAVTSANPTFASDPGLADRLLIVRLERRIGTTAESTLTDEIAAIRDSGLSWIAQKLSQALGDSQPVPECLNPRHPDFAKLAVRIGRAMGMESEAIAALQAAEADKGLLNVEHDPISAAVLEICKDEPFRGSAKELLEKITQFDSAFAGKLSPKKLVHRLSNMWPHLQAVFNAREETDLHAKIKIYEFTPAGFAGIKTGSTQNPPINSSMRTFSQTLTENPQTPQTELEIS